MRSSQTYQIGVRPAYNTSCNHGPPASPATQKDLPQPLSSQLSSLISHLSSLTIPAHPPSFSSLSLSHNPHSSSPRSRGHVGALVTYSNHFSCPLASCSRSSTTSPLHPPVYISRRTFPTSLL